MLEWLAGDEKKIVGRRGRGTACPYQILVFVGNYRSVSVRRSGIDILEISRNTIWTKHI